MNLSILVWTGIALISVFSIGETWWARYVPQLWLVPILIVIAILCTTRKPILRLIPYLVIILLCVNSEIILFVNTKSAMGSSDYVAGQLDAMRDGSQQHPVDIAFNGFAALRERFKEKSIHFIEYSGDQLPCDKDQPIKFIWTSAYYCPVGGQNH
jgi:hypothetical protein